MSIDKYEISADNDKLKTVYEFKSSLFLLDTKTSL